ncbi:MAG: DoxX family protein [Undibacterium sp.]|nr:DoxX family protein [Opitutaceae bacterium]
MTPSLAPPRALWPLLARLVLGAAFLHLGTVKALDPVGFLKLVRQFDALSQPFALNAVAAILPWFEIVCGLLLLAGVRPRGTALVTLALLLGFTSLVAQRAWVIYRGGGWPFCAIRFDCGCGAGEVLICTKLAENTALALLALAVLLWPGHRYCLWPETDTE